MSRPWKQAALELCELECRLAWHEHVMQARPDEYDFAGHAQSWQHYRAQLRAMRDACKEKLALLEDGEGASAQGGAAAAPNSD